VSWRRNATWTGPRSRPFPFEATLAVVLAATAGCGGEGTGLSGSDGPCAIAVSPRTVNFGVVQPGRSAQRPLELRNASASATCRVGPVRLEPLEGEGFALFDGASSDLAEGGGSVVLPPETAIFMPLGFSPVGPGPHRARLKVETDDPERPVVAVELVGSTARGELLVVPEDLFFGERVAGCEDATKTVTVYNSTGLSATFDAATLVPTGSTFSLEPSGALPVTLEPSGSHELTVRFEPRDVAVAESVLRLQFTTRGNATEHTLLLRGRGVAAENLQIDQFEVPSRLRNDVMIVFDPRPSMARERERFAEQLEPMMDLLAGFDFHLASTTSDLEGDSGAFLPVGGGSEERIITKDTAPTPLDALVDQIAAASGREAPNHIVESARAALSPPRITSGLNAGFLRQDAIFWLILITDRPDASPESSEVYRSFSSNLRGGRHFSAMTFVSGGLDGCDSPTGTADPAPRLVELAEATGGHVVDVCDPNWGWTLVEGAIRDRWKPQMHFTNDPIASTIRVFVDDVAVPRLDDTGAPKWRHDPTTNALRFTDPDFPEPGARVRVEYAVTCP